MHYFIIAGEASGDLHASQLIEALRASDSEARFTFLGGDMMASAAGNRPIIHYRDMAYMGFSEVLRHLPEVLGNLRTAKHELLKSKPDAFIAVDYPSFNLKVARTAAKAEVPVFYYISPKLWAYARSALRPRVEWRALCVGAVASFRVGRADDYARKMAPAYGSRTHQTRLYGDV